LELGIAKLAVKWMASLIWCLGWKGNHPN